MWMEDFILDQCQKYKDYRFEWESSTQAASRLIGEYTIDVLEEDVAYNPVDEAPTCHLCFAGFERAVSEDYLDEQGRACRSQTTYYDCGTTVSMEVFWSEETGERKVTRKAMKGDDCIG